MSVLADAGMTRTEFDRMIHEALGDAALSGTLCYVDRDGDSVKYNGSAGEWRGMLQQVGALEPQARQAPGAMPTLRCTLRPRGPSPSAAAMAMTQDKVQL